MSGYIEANTQSGNEVRETPDWLFNFLDKEFNFTLDPCAFKEIAKCDKYYNPEDDGLSQDWSDEIVWMNPPYGRGKTYKWLKKAYKESKKGATVVCLVICAPSRNYWHELIFPNADQIRLFKGRLKFKGFDTDHPASHALVIFDGSDQDYDDFLVWDYPNRKDKI